MPLRYFCEFYGTNAAQVHLVPNESQVLTIMGEKMKRADKTSSMADEIDKNIKRAFDEVVNEELPSRFTDLLNQLKAQDAEKSGGSETSDDA